MDEIEKMLKVGIVYHAQSWHIIGAKANIVVLKSTLGRYSMLVMVADTLQGHPWEHQMMGQVSWTPKNSLMAHIDPFVLILDARTHLSLYWSFISLSKLCVGATSSFTLLLAKWSRVVINVMKNPPILSSLPSFTLLLAKWSRVVINNSWATNTHILSSLSSFIVLLVKWAREGNKNSRATNTHIVWPKLNLPLLL